MYYLANKIQCSAHYYFDKQFFRIKLLMI